MALPGPRRRDSETRGFAACICAQAGSFERSRGLGFATGPLNVTLPLSLVPPCAPKTAAGTQQRSAVAKQARAGRRGRKPWVLVNPEIMGLRKLRSAAERDAKRESEDLPCQPRANSILRGRWQAGWRMRRSRFKRLLTF